MSNSATQWFQSKPFAQQLIIIAAVFDPLGFAGGFLLGPSFGVDPLIGGIYGLLAASVPMSLHVLSYATQAE
jgi:hypothetical protein